MATYDIRTQIPDKIVTGDILNCPYSGSAKSLTLPKGQYKLECWGAQGGYRSSSTYGGKGGYSVGTLNLTTPSTIYFYTGGSGYTGDTNGGFNGGGVRYSYKGGGGASDIRIGADSLYARVIVAGGGGSDGSSSKGGGVGGGTSGAMPATTSYGTNYSKQGTATGVAGGSSYLATSKWTSANPTTAASTYAGFGFGGAGPYRSSGYGGAGGGGWYGGGGNYPDTSGDDDAGGAGGSGYVYTSSTYSQYPSGCLLNASHYLESATTYAGNTSFPSTSGSTETGHTGDGYIRVTLVKVDSGLECYVKQNSSWNSGEVYNKQNGEWTKELEGIPSEYLDICIPSLASAFTFDNTVKTPEWSHYLSKYMIIFGVTSATKAGTYTATFSLKKDTYRWFNETTESKNVEWTIAKRVLSVPTQSNTLTYNKASQSPTWNNHNSTYMTLGGTTSGTNAGTYSATFTIKDTDSCVWSDGSTEPKTVSWSIGVLKLTKPIKSSTTYTYTGSSQTLSFSDFNGSYETKSGDYLATNAGSYTCSIVLDDTMNTQWSDGTTSTLTFSWSIAKRTLTVPTQSGTLTYTGSSQSPSWNNYNSTYMTLGGDTSGTNAGSYAATFTIKSPDNCTWSDGTTAVKSVNWTIAKVSITIPSCSAVKYTGEMVSPVWENYDDTKMSISGDISGIEIGSYTTVFSLIVDTTNYQWSDGTIADQSVVWEIKEHIGPVWEVIQPTGLSHSRSTLAATTVGNYALFGGGNNSTSSDVSAYDTSLTYTHVISLSEGSRQLAATTVGSYALFGGGTSGASVPVYKTIVNAYNTSLTRTIPTVLSQGRHTLAATTIGNYALFGGGYGSGSNLDGTSYYSTVDAYDTSLTRTTPTALNVARYELAATTVGNYALFGGGAGGIGGRDEYFTVDAYDTSLTHTIATRLSDGRQGLAATTVGNYALFGGGVSGNGRTYYSTVDAYNTSLTRTTPTALNVARYGLAATTVGNYALFGGGYDNSIYYSTVDAYDTSLTYTIPIALSVTRTRLAATTIGNYALFGGGVSDSGSTYYSTVDAISYMI